MHFMRIVSQTPQVSSTQSLARLSCIIETEQTEGTEMLQILVSWVPDFISDQVQRQLHRTGIYVPVRSERLEASNTLT